MSENEKTNKSCETCEERQYIIRLARKQAYPELIRAIECNCYLCTTSPYAYVLRDAWNGIRASVQSTNKVVD